MSVENIVLKNMYDMGNINTKDNLKSIFTSYNKDIIIEMSRKKINRFSSDIIDMNYMCSIVFKNSLGNILKELIISEIDVGILIDNIYNFLENTVTDCIIHFNSSDTRCIDNTIQLSHEINEIGFHRDIFSLYNYMDDQLIKVLSFDITNSLVEFVDMLYYTFLIDIRQYGIYNPTNNFNINL